MRSEEQSKCRKHSPTVSIFHCRVLNPRHEFLAFNHLPENLFLLTPFPTLTIALIPFTLAAKNFYRGVIISKGQTKLLLFSESFEIIALIVIFFTALSLFSAPAINLAMISLWMASFTNLCLLWWWDGRS